MNNIFSQPLVSICVVTYNQEDYIGETLEGILKQDYKNYEVIVADDASKDKTPEIVESFKNKFKGRLRLLRQQQNKGVVGNTIDCILEAKSKYIAICEGDDFWIDSNKLTKQIETLEYDDSISMCHSNWADYIQKDNIYKHIEQTGNDYCEKHLGNKSVEEIILHKYKGIRLSSICFRKKLFINFIDSHPEFLSNSYPTLDLEIFYIMAHQGKLYYDDKAMVAYRVLDGTVSNSPHVEKRANYAFGILKIESFFIKTYHLSKQCTDYAFRRSLSFLSVYCLENKNKDMARRLIYLAHTNNYKLRIGQKLCFLGAKYPLIYHIAKFILNIRKQFHK